MANGADFSKPADLKLRRRRLSAGYWVVVGIHGLTRLRRAAPHAALSLVLTFSLVMVPVWAVRFARFTASV